MKLRLDKSVRFSLQFDDWNEVLNLWAANYYTDEPDICIPGTENYTFHSLTRNRLTLLCRDANDFKRGSR